ncbi:Alpha/Beta hydrolase protein [Cyathus striatus]|nr:Alpha/Beta hydrolase protein [Cyathus striatus]KAF8993234.1 Alpha/Beta hydrolase protein [Cyathus striatus]
MSYTGIAEFTFGGKVYQTWYKVFGDLKESGKRPLVALHGGPGMSHHYMLRHKILYEKARIPVVVYDEIGNGKSSHALDEPKEFWNLEVFMVQLESLLRHLEISSDFDLLGHSWGGIVSASYAALRAPAGLKHLIVANSPADMVKFAEGTNALFEKHFPKELVTRVRELQESGQGESEEYQQGVGQFYKKFICSLDPWPEDVVESMKAIQTNGNVHNSLLGTSMLQPNGNLKNWSIVADLHKIRVPLLLISSPVDVVQEAAIIPYFLHTPKVKWVELPNTTHSPMSEDPERYFAAILAFLESVA